MNLKEALGAEEDATAQKFSIYIPDRDSQGRPVSHINAWIELALQIMTEINGGATCMPAVGKWKYKRKVVFENTKIVYSFIRKPKLFEANLERIVALLHSFGKTTNQGEVMVEFASEEWATFICRSYFIRSYPKAKDLPLSTLG